MESKIDRELEQRLKGFEEVWRRVAGDMLKLQRANAALMPRKDKKPKRRFEPHY